VDLTVFVQYLDGLVFILAHQGSIPGYVSEHDGSKASLLHDGFGIN
jgi:hypothetical protein